MSPAVVEVTKTFSLKLNRKLAHIKYSNDSFWLLKENRFYMSRETWELIGEVMGWCAPKQETAGKREITNILNSNLANSIPEIIKNLKKMSESRKGRK